MYVRLLIFIFTWSGILPCGLGEKGRTAATCQQLCYLTVTVALFTWVALTLSIGLLFIFVVTFNVYYEHCNCYLCLPYGFLLIDLFIQHRLLAPPGLGNRWDYLNIILLVLIHIKIIFFPGNKIDLSFGERLNSRVL